MQAYAYKLLIWLACVLGWTAFSEVKATLVTMQVDLSQESSVSPNGVHVIGAFNGFDPTATPLINVGPGQYAISLNFSAGSNVHYKFVNGNTWDGTEGVYGDCAFNTYRRLIIPANDTVLNWACFGYCDSACTTAPGIRLACVGNSITYGVGTMNPELGSYPAQLQSTLGASYLVGNFGASGTTVIHSSGNPYVETDQFRHLLRFAPDTVLLILGINDTKSAVWGPYGYRFAADYDSIWMAMDTLASDPHIFICLPTTAHSSQFGIDLAVERDSIVPILKAHARKHCLDQIDMLGFTSGLASGFPDGIHPDSATCKLMADEMLRIMHFPRPEIIRNGQVLKTNGGFSWQWYYNGDTVATAAGGQLDSLVAILPGTYKVAQRVDIYQHILFSDTVEVLPVAIDVNETMEIEIYPVPTMDRIHWKVGEGLGGVIALKLANLLGQVCWETATADHAGEIDLSMLPAGLYFLRFEQGEREVYKPVWKE
jgi:hypothetical protein